MADKKKMSVEDILAAARAEDGGASSDSSPAPDQASEAKSSTPEPKAKTSTSSAKPGEMSVSDIMAAARGSDSGTSSEPQEEAAESTEAPAQPGDTAGKKPTDMNIAEIMAAARGGGSQAKAKPAARPKAKVAKAAPSDKKSPKAPSKPVRTGPMDTSSILAAARSESKPGPISKAEAAAKGNEVAAKSAKSKPVLPPLPDKPAYAKPKPEREAASEDRRGFISVFLGSFLAIGFSSLALTNMLWALGLARFMFPNILIEPPNRFKIGFPGDFAAGAVATKFKAQFGVWVTNVEYEGQQQIVALKTVCTHLGCTPNWLEAEQKFKCPCHGSGFYIDGINFEGPAPRPLERYAIRLADDGQLEVDKSKTFQEQLGQWQDPACFVLV